MPKIELDALAPGTPNTDDDVEGATNEPNVEEAGVWPFEEKVPKDGAAAVEEAKILGPGETATGVKVNFLFSAGRVS